MSVTSIIVNYDLEMSTSTKRNLRAIVKSDVNEKFPQ